MSSPMLADYSRKLRNLRMTLRICSISSRGTKKSQLKEPDEEKPISPEKSQKCAHTMAFFGRNWLFFVRVKKLAFLRTPRRYITHQK